MWKLLDTQIEVSPDEAVKLVASNAEAGLLMTSFERDDGAVLIYLENRRRALLVLIDHDGEPLGQLVSPGAPGVGDGYVLDNGQVDEYPDAESVPIAEAIRELPHVMKEGRPREGVLWSLPR